MIYNDYKLNYLINWIQWNNNFKRINRDEKVIELFKRLRKSQPFYLNNYLEQIRS